MTSKMKPPKETLLNSYIDVKSWGDTDVRKAARWLAEELSMGVGNIEVYEDYRYLLPDKENQLVWVIESHHHCPHQITDVSFIFNTEEESVTNSLESLKKAKQELAFAKDCLKASQEAVEEAQKAYTEAYKAFKEEADGLLREEDKTSEEPCSSFLAKHSPVDHTKRSLSVGDVYSVIKTVKEDCVSYIVLNDYGTKIHFPSVYEFCQRFQRIE